MTINDNNNLEEVHRIYTQRLQDLEGDMVELGYDHYDVVKVLLVYIHSILHNKDLDEKIRVYDIILNHIFDILKGLKEEEGVHP